MYIYLYTVCEGIQSRIRIPLFKNCERSEPEKYLRIELLRAKLAEVYGKNWQAPPPPHKL